METKVRTPRQKRGIETKERILESAIGLFAEGGFHRANTKEIAKAAGVSTGAFYAYYPDKKAVLLEAIRFYFRRFDDIVEERASIIARYYDDRRTVISGLIMSIIEAHGPHRGFHEMIYGMAATDPEVRALVAEHDDRSDDRIRALLVSAGVSLGEGELKAAATVLSAAIQGAVDRIVDMGDDRRALVDALVELIHRFAFREG
jgi:AcrR family transcriptional regulator